MESIHYRIRNRLERALQFRKLKPYAERLQAIRALSLEQETDARLRERASRLIQAARGGACADDLLIESFALTYEAVRRILNIGLYDVQLMAGMALHEGKLVEMQTGEGKTLAAVLPACLHALYGQGAHMMTFNDYLAGRDAAWMGPVYEYLGLTVGCVREGMPAAERRAAYAADVTYVTAKEAGFDYLRDGLCMASESLVQRPFHLALIDEADSILIDEARVPLVIAGEGKPPGDRADAERMAALAKRLRPGLDYDVDDAGGQVYLTEAGAERAEALLGCGSLYDPEQSGLLVGLHHALHAEALLRRDVDYIVREGQVELVDEFTGRIADKRRWPDGVQAAVEAKEGVAPQPGGRILGMITLQHLLSLYPSICGMSGTLRSSADELRDTYQLEVAVIPPNRPCRRQDEPSLVSPNLLGKQRALLTEIASVHRTGRPILVGTASVAESDRLAQALEQAGVPCCVLNAKHDEEEAELIARAGTWGAVTISTNMAGRGVDIVLGGGDPAQYAKIAQLGGLYVIGTNLHDSRRLDDQLRGRAGRQGDPGMSRFFLSLEDSLLHRYGREYPFPERWKSAAPDKPLRGTAVPRLLAHIQRVAEGRNAERRRMLNRYEEVLEQQRRIIATWRRDVLMEEAPPPLKLAEDAARHERLCRQWGAERVRRLEKRVTLLHIDQRWSDYVEFVSAVREGLHLEGLSRQDPLDLFHQRLIGAFADLPHLIEDSIRQELRALDESGPDIWPEEEPPRQSTWTYLLHDHVVPNRFSLF